MSSSLTEKEISYVVENNAKKLIMSLPDCRILIFYPDLVELLITFIENIDDNFLKQIFPSLITLNIPVKKQLIDNLRQKNKIILSNIFVANPCVDINTVRNSQLYNLNRFKFDNYIIEAGFSFTSEQYKKLFDLLSDTYCSMLLNTLSTRQVFSLMTLLPEQKFLELIPNIEGYYYNEMIGVL